MKAPALASLLCLLLLSACGEGSYDDDEMARDYPEDLDGVVYEHTSNYHAPGLNEMVTLADAALIVRVDSVSESRSTTSGGEGEEVDGQVPAFSGWRNYREARVTVERILFEGPAANVSVGKQVSVFLRGSGEASGEELAAFDAEIPLMDGELISGPVEPGSLGLWIVNATDYPLETGSVPTLMLSANLLSQWEIIDQEAVSAVPGRSVSDVDRLIERIIDERDRGPIVLGDFEVEATQVDPMADPAVVRLAPDSTEPEEEVPCEGAPEYCNQTNDGPP